VITALLVLLCGGGSAVARFAVDELVSERIGGSYPFGTLIVNLSGCFALGVIVGIAPDHRVTELFGTAAIGSYTTFSTWLLESHRAAQDGDTRIAIWSIVVALVLGLAVADLGRVIGGWL
jgi:fluoride exporter